MTPDLIRAFLAGGPAVRVVVAEAAGSTPRERGAWMLVGAASTLGTIGGGQLEYLAIDEARRHLAAGTAAGLPAALPATLPVPLGPEIGQCCGGRVVLRLEAVDDEVAAALLDAVARAERARPAVLLFGAGHVGRAVAAALALLPVRVRVVETRAAELDQLCAGVETRLTALPEAEVDAAPPGAAYLVMTHDHALDFLIAQRALDRGDGAYVGMIGSATKRAAFAGWVARETGSQAATARLHCPIGAAAPVDKRPEVIAAFVAAEVMVALLDRPAAATVANSAPAGDEAGCSTR